MDDARSEHPDEGVIHAWLDGALDSATSQALAAHVASCRECAERVAEARGLIAGASRVVNALDDAPSAAAPVWGRAPVTPVAGKAGAGTAWRMLRVTPARAAIAATVLVALGVSLTYRRTAVDTEASRAMRGDVAMPTAAARAHGPAAPEAPLHDPVLDSAVARNLAAAQPPRVLKAAPGPEIPQPTVVVVGAAVADAAAPTRVGAGRAAMRAQRDSTAGLRPDQVLAGRVAGSAVAEATVSAAKRADSIASPPVGVAAASAPAQSTVQLDRAPSSRECYRVESASGSAATWGPVPLPLVVAMDVGGRSARVLTPAGQSSDASALVTRAGEDSLLLRLRRLGYEGTLALGAAGEMRAGVMRSRQNETRLESVVVTSAEAANEQRARRARPTPQAKSAPTAPDSAAASAATSGYSAAPAVPVVARRISCEF